MPDGRQTRAARLGGRILRERGEHLPKGGQQLRERDGTEEVALVLRGTGGQQRPRWALNPSREISRALHTIYVGAFARAVARWPFVKGQRPSVLACL